MVFALNSTYCRE